MWIKPLTEYSGYWGLAFYDRDGQTVEEHRIFALTVGEWNQLTFTQGEKIQHGWYRAGPGDPTRVTRIVFRAQTRDKDQEAADLWDDFRMISGS